MMKLNYIFHQLILLSPFIFSQAWANSECASLICLNGGTCYTQIAGDTVVNEYCVCPPDKDGETCAELKPCGLSCVYGECRYPFSPAGVAAVDDVDKEPFCKCDDGYSGILCESEIEVCPDGELTCFNGAQCQEVKKVSSDAGWEDETYDPPRYACDCSVIDSRSPYAGIECQHPAERICSIMTKSTSSFCVNGGICTDIVMTEDVHRGCECPSGFEGDHCEYVEGTNPQRINSFSSLSNSSGNTNQTSTRQRLNGIGIFFVVLILTSAFFGGIYTAREMKKKQRALQEAAAAYDDNDLAFDADGNRMTNISINGDLSEREGEVI